MRLTLASSQWCGDQVLLLEYALFLSFERLYGLRGAPCRAYSCTTTHPPCALLTFCSFGLPAYSFNRPMHACFAALKASSLESI